jgi:hypothetical protein
MEVNSSKPNISYTYLGGSLTVGVGTYYWGIVYNDSDTTLKGKTIGILRIQYVSSKPYSGTVEIGANNCSNVLQTAMKNAGVTYPTITDSPYATSASRSSY